MTAAEARAYVRAAYRRGSLTSGEYSDALRDIDAGRVDSTVRYLRSLHGAVTE